MDQQVDHAMANTPPPLWDSVEQVFVAARSDGDFEIFATCEGGVCHRLIPDVGTLIMQRLSNEQEEVIDIFAKDDKVFLQVNSARTLRIDIFGHSSSDDHPFQNEVKRESELRHDFLPSDKWSFLGSLSLPRLIWPDRPLQCQSSQMRVWNDQLFMMQHVAYDEEFSQNVFLWSEPGRHELRWKFWTCHDDVGEYYEWCNLADFPCVHRHNRVVLLNTNGVGEPGVGAVRQLNICPYKLVEDTCSKHIFFQARSGVFRWSGDDVTQIFFTPEGENIFDIAAFEEVVYVVCSDHVYVCQEGCVSGVFEIIQIYSSLASHEGMIEKFIGKVDGYPWVLKFGALIQLSLLQKTTTQASICETCGAFCLEVGLGRELGIAVCSEIRFYVSASRKRSR
jgi:hypothetical protein